jgi:AraC-like DNA-binding protein
MLNIGYRDKLHSATKLAALFEALFDEGIPPTKALLGLQLRAEDLHQPTTLVSINQMVEACRNATRLSTDPHLAYRVGSSIHLSAYGMYGYAILCSTDFRRTMEFAVRYHPLATPLTTISFEESNKSAKWVIAPLPHPLMDATLCQFVTELQIGIHLSLLRDVFGASFVPREICFTGSAAFVRLTPDLAGCPIFFGHPANQIVFDPSWLDRVPTLGNRTTHAVMLEVCDQLLVDLGRDVGVSGKVRQVLLENISERPSLKGIAKRLSTTERTLRRQLRTEDTSFRKLLDELRMQLAIKYLRDTHMTGEDIAVAVGFSDAANFGRAFRRWTAESPSVFKGAKPTIGLPFDH